MEYEVGKYYEVVCALLQSKYSDRIIIVPIIDLLHKDAQFGADHFHYHIDGRFVTKKMQLAFCMNGGKTNVPIWTDKDVDNYWIFKLTTTIKLKCKRTETGLIINHFMRDYWVWYRSMIGKSCKGKRCPHLGTQMLERNGQLVCPLHNLVGCKEKEIIIPQ